MAPKVQNPPHMKKMFSFCSALILLALSNSALALSRMDFSFFLGPSLSQSGAIQKLGDPNINTGFDFNYYFNDKSGIGATYSSEGQYDGTKDIPRLDQASLSTFDIHYTYRLALSKGFHLVFQPGFGWQTLYDDATDYYWYYVYRDDLSSALILNYKIIAKYYFSQGEGFFFGGGFMQTFSFNDTYQQEDIEGNRLSGVLQLGIGF